MGRAPCCDKANVKKGPWSSEEDATLKAYIEKYGTGGNWIALPQKIGLKRCGKSCRLRWLNYLRPNIKHGGFTDEEDNIICSLYISIGSRWSIIAAQLPGRTDNDIKNYWNTRLKKKLLGRRKQSDRINNRLLISGQEAKDFNGEENSICTLQNMSSSALERLQLHMHLQTLQNPLSFYNNPSLFPKLSLLQQSMSHNLNCLNENQDLFVQEIPVGVPEQDYRASNELKRVELMSSMNAFSSSESSFDALKIERNVTESDVVVQNRGIERVSGFDDLLHSQTAEFDCFKVMGDPKDGTLAWWNNEFETNSSSSNSWSSATMFDQAEEMYRDYATMGYSMQ